MRICFCCLMLAGSIFQQKNLYEEQFSLSKLFVDLVQPSASTTTRHTPMTKPRLSLKRCVVPFHMKVCMNNRRLGFTLASTVSQDRLWFISHTSGSSVLYNLTSLKAKYLFQYFHPFCTVRCLQSIKKPDMRLNTDRHCVFTHRHHTPAPRCRWVGPCRWPGRGSTGCSRVPLSRSLLLGVRSILSAG